MNADPPNEHYAQWETTTQRRELFQMTLELHVHLLVYILRKKTTTKNTHTTLVSSFTFNINNIGAVILKQVLLML